MVLQTTPTKVGEVRSIVLYGRLLYENNNNNNRKTKDSEQRVCRPEFESKLCHWIFAWPLKRQLELFKPLILHLESGHDNNNLSH